jgi:hypothetical protein
MVYDPKNGCVRGEEVGTPDFYEPISFPTLYRPQPQNFGTREHFESILKDISIGNWELHLRQDAEGGRFFIQIQFVASDNESGEENCRQYCRKWYLSKHMTKSEVVRTAYLAYQQAILHEADETFKFHGQSIYNPHINVYSLVAACQLHDVRK